MSVRSRDRIGGWFRPDSGALLAVVLPVVLVVAGLTGAVAGSRVDLRSGAAWLASVQGQIILVSGSAARRVAAFPVSAPGQDLSLVQTTDAVFLVNRTASSVTRMDTATFRVTPPVPFPGAAGRLQVLVGGGHLYVLDGQTGLVQTLDPATMTPVGSPRSLDIQVDPGGAVVDRTGRIWAVSAGSGVLRWLDESSLGTGTTIANAALVLAGGAAVAVAAGRANWLSSGGEIAASVDLGALAGETPEVSGAPDGRLLVAIPGRALVRTCESDGCESAIARLPDAGSRFGAPQLLGDVVLVPDLERGMIHLVRPGQGAAFAAPAVMPANTDFEIVVHEGFAFYNAVGNERAGVLRINGDFVPVQKYQPEDPNKGLDTPATSIESSEPPSSSAAPSTLSTVPATPTVVPTTSAAVTTVRPTRTTSVPTTSRVAVTTSSPPSLSSIPSAAPPATPVITGLSCTPANPAAGDQVRCTAAESAAGADASWTWRVRDADNGSGVGDASAQAAGQEFRFTPPRLGSFTVELTVDNRGAIDSETFPVVSKVALPDLRGMTAAQARDELRALGLTPATENRPSRSAAGTVLGTEPATAVNWGQPVTVLISSGPNPPVALGNLAAAAVWTNGNGVRLPWPGDEGDDRGFARPAGGFPLASGATAPGNSFETHPQWISGGQISGRFQLPNPILAGDRFTGALDFRQFAGGSVRFWVSKVRDGGGLQPLSAPQTVGAGSVAPFDVDLSAAAGETDLVLTVDANGDSGQDWAIWIDPTIL